MAQYFLHIDGDSTDITVYEADDVATAKCEAVKFAGQLICDEAGTFWDTREVSITVANADGLTLFTLLFIGTEAPAISARL